MKKTKLVTALVFVLLIGGISIASLVHRTDAFSENENRYLTDFPKLTWDNFISGRFQSGLEDYLKDHVIGRNQMVSGHTAVLQLMGNCDINGVYTGEDGYLFQKIAPQDVDEKILEENVKSLQNYFDGISNLVDRDCMSFMLVPTADFACDTKMPKYAIQFQQDKYMEGIKNSFRSYNYIDIRPVLESQDKEQLYYRTDHHWTSLGAYYAYRVWCQRTNHVVWNENRFERKVVSNRFRGSLYSKVLNWNAPWDEIVQYNGNDGYEFAIQKDGKDTDSFYDEAALEGKDKYAYFLGGNYAEVAIERLATKDDNGAERNLLLIKDSFANCFLPYIAKEYDKIYMIDLRHYNGDMIEYVKEHEITDVLVLYNISNFIEDRNLRKLTVTAKREPEEAPPTVPTEPSSPAETPAITITTPYTPEVHGNLILLGDRAFETYAYKDNMAQKYADGLNELEKQLNGKAKVYDVLVPLNSGVAFPDAYWDAYHISDQKLAIDQMQSWLNSEIGFVDAYSQLMAHRDEYLYFRTDHHWTGLGAYYGYVAYCTASGLTPVPLEKYKTVEYKGFLGSLYREYPNPAMEGNPDTVVAYLPLSDSEMTITDIYGKVTREGILADGNTIPQSDKYCTFIHGDHPFSDVINKNLHDGSSCIVVKESFGNAFVPFLIEHYEHVYVVDYRYWNGNLQELVNQTGADSVIFVNNLYAIRNQYLLGKILGTIYK